MSSTEYHHLYSTVRKGYAGDARVSSKRAQSHGHEFLELTRFKHLANA